VKSEADFDAALKALGANKDLYAEKWSHFKMELAVMVVKTKDGVLSYPTVETIHENSICKLTYSPARGVSKDINEKAQALARKAVDCFWGKGVFGVEMFLQQDNTLLINEIAPRPHNSGHYTIEACPLSQYDAHLRAILDLPITQKNLRLREPSIMLNILGGEAPDSHMQAAKKALELFGGEGVHLYGKGEARKGRKMGHVTITAPTMAEAEKMIQPLVDFMDQGKDKSSDTPAREIKEQPLVAVVMGSDSDLQCSPQVSRSSTNWRSPTPPASHPLTALLHGWLNLLLPLPTTASRPSSPQQVAPPTFPAWQQPTHLFR
jgi:phosphoribosylaminoimidazole carboxylase